MSRTAIATTAVLREEAGPPALCAEDCLDHGRRAALALRSRNVHHPPLSQVLLLQDRRNKTKKIKNRRRPVLRPTVMLMRRMKSRISGMSLARSFPPDFLGVESPPLSVRVLPPQSYRCLSRT